MNTPTKPDYGKIKAERARNGLIYGILSALAFSLTVWGYDGYLLANASAGLPWLKLVIGAGITMLLGGFIGWLTARLDNTLVGFVGWLFSGIVFGWLASHLPFDISTLALRLIKTPVHELVTLPYPENIWRQMLIVYGLLVIAAALVGILETNLVESASTAYSSLMRWLLLAVCIPLFALPASAADFYINQPLRKPIQAVHELIQNGIQNEITPFSSKQIAQMRLRALGPIQDSIHKPYKLYIGSYDPEYLDNFNVLVDFAGTWAQCSVLIDSPSNCGPLNKNTASNLPVAPGPAQVDQQTSPTPTNPSATQSPTVPTSTSQKEVVMPLRPEALPAVVNQDPHYTLSLNVDEAQHSFTGHARVDYTNLESTALDRLYFRLIPNGHRSYGNGSLSVSQTLVENQPVETQLSLQDSVLEVPLPQSLESGDKTQIEFTFSGQVPVNFGGANSGGYGIYNYSDNVLALSGWYPILAVYNDQGWHLDPVSDIGDSIFSDTAFYSVDVSVPENLVVAATGVAEDQRTEAGRSIYHFESGPARDFFLIMSPDFQSDSQALGDTTINSYYLPGHSQGGQAALQVATDSLRIYNQEFGPYPYTEFDVVEAPMRNASGVEFPGIVLIGDSLYEDAETPNFIVTVAHEVAHQWWYNVIGNNVFDDPWMDEALTTYSSSLYYEFGHGGSQAVSGLVSYWDSRYSQVRQEGKDDGVAQSLAHFESLNNPGVYSGIVYSKGGLFFKNLRQEIGDQAFFTALRNYYQQYQFQIATPDDLLNTFEDAAGRQLDDFYRQWLEPPGS